MRAIRKVWRAMVLTLVAVVVSIGPVSSQSVARVHRIAILSPNASASPTSRAALDEFRRTLRELGYAEGRNLNSAAARALGLTIPPAVLVRAQEVIQ